MCRWRCETVVEKRSMQVGSVYSETMVEVFVIFFIIPCFSFVMLNAAVPKPRNNMNRPKGVVPEHYVKEVRPPTYKGTPLEVQFSMKVVDINSINVEDMDFRMDMFLKQQWTDARLHIPEEMFSDGDDYFTMPTQFFDNLWHPDLYFINSKVVEIATLTHKFTSVTVYRNKTVRYSARMHAIVACQMEFRHYPMDIQICPLYIESFSYNNQKMQLKWADAGVSVSPELKLLQYHIGTPLEVEEKNVHTSEKGGNFSRLVVYFRFERQIGHHLIQTFAPSTLVVMLSWFSFWLGLDAVPGRMTLLVTCMLTLVTMFTGLRSDIPPVAYVKALDVWMAGCMLFVFAALGEFVVVKVLDQRYQIYRKRESIQNTERALSPWCSCGKEKHNKRKTSLVQITWKNKYGEEYTLWHKIDRLSRIIFPGLFLLFILIYWPALVFGNSYPIID